MDNHAIFGVKPEPGQEGCTYYRLDLESGYIQAMEENPFADKETKIARRNTSSPVAISSGAGDEFQAALFEKLIAESPPAIRVRYEVLKHSQGGDDIEEQIIDRLKPLVAAGVDLDARDKDGQSLLNHSRWGRKVLFYLLENGADPNVDVGLNSPLIPAIFRDDTEIAAALLDAGANPNVVGEHYAPLHDAAEMCRPRIAELLIEAGADVNARAHRKRPIEGALYMGCWAVVGQLLENGASTEELTLEDRVFLAIYQNDLQTVAGLFNADPQFDVNREVLPYSIAAAAELGRAEIASRLIAFGVDPDSTTGNYRTTPLILSIHTGATDVTRMLLNKGADPNQTDRYGFSPLDVAILFNSPEAVALIEAAGGSESLGTSHLTPHDQNEHYRDWYARLH